MDQLFGIPIGQLTVNGLALVAIGLVVTGFITGRIIPLRTHNRELAAANERTADFRELWQVADKRGDVIESVAEDLVIVGENMNKVLKALPTPHQEA
jgi:hypothetical protein